MIRLDVADPNMGCWNCQALNSVGPTAPAAMLYALHVGPRLVVLFCPDCLGLLRAVLGVGPGGYGPGGGYQPSVPERPAAQPVGGL